MKHMSIHINFIEHVSQYNKLNIQNKSICAVIISSAKMNNYSLMVEISQYGKDDNICKTKKKGPSMVSKLTVLKAFK